MGQVTHALLTRPPLSRGRFIPEGIPYPCSVRLACVKHAASVHPEPGSNSHVEFQSGLRYAFWLSLFRFHHFCDALLFLGRNSRCLFFIRIILLNLSRLFHCSVVKVPLFNKALIVYHSSTALSRLFLNCFRAAILSCGQL